MEQCITDREIDCSKDILTHIRKYHKINFDYDNFDSNTQINNTDTQNLSDNKETTYVVPMNSYTEIIPSTHFNSLSTYISKVFINPVNFSHINTMIYQPDIMHLQRLVDYQLLFKDYNLPRDCYYVMLQDSENAKFSLKHNSANNILQFYEMEIEKLKKIKNDMKNRDEALRIEEILIRYANKKDYFLST